MNIRSLGVNFMDRIHKISVRKLASFTDTTERISKSFFSLNKAIEGTNKHTYLHNIFESQFNNYLSEVTVNYLFESSEFKVEISGRIDGLLQGTSVFEIKSTDCAFNELSFNSNPIHAAQLKIYGYIYAIQNNLHEIELSLVYIKRTTNEYKFFTETFSIDNLQSFFNKLIFTYINWQKALDDWYELRNSSIKKIPFPYDNYRNGQRTMAQSVYRTIQAEKKLFLQAPTGTGKTIGTLFPSIKAIGEGLINKIFYLTAKTITRTVAVNAYLLLKEKGLNLRTLVLTAKEKICFQDNMDCDEETCPYLNNFSNKCNDAIEAILEDEFFSREKIELIAKEYNVCPFELSLSLALYSDLIICDYNYLFDPNVSLRRFFQDNTSEKFCFLVDEAHNLVERARDMYSTGLSKNDILGFRRLIKTDYPSLYKILSKINNYFLKLKKELLEKEGNILLNFSDNNTHKELQNYLEEFLFKSEKYLDKKEAPYKKELLDMYFTFLSFIKISSIYDKCYITVYKIDNSDLFIKLFCLDPSLQLKKCMDLGRSSIIFSATLSPIEYFMPVLGGEIEDPCLILPSPFPEKNLLLYINDTISTKYKNRDSSYNKIAEIIKETVSNKIGNYLVFFPSYQYMKNVIESFDESDYNILVQESSMNEEDREEYLRNFESNGVKSLIAFAVLGGIFGEGIDLVGDKLKGVFIVGVGLPQICYERDLIKKYYNTVNNNGFDFSYTFPGMNRVLQAAGRVIRTETDTGFVILIDDRFSTYKYKQLFPKEWSLTHYSSKSKPLQSIISEFFSNENNYST